MSLRLPSAKLLLTALCAFLLLAAATPAAACEGEIFFRLVLGGEEWWYDYGETIELEPGSDGAIYIHVAAGGDDTYTTAALIGYPTEFGYQGDARVVERTVRMQAQNNEDKSYGRIRFRTGDQNAINLGYRITGVARPGSMNDVSGNCRVGYIPIRVAYSEE
jgi:hypothetical protein